MDLTIEGHPAELEWLRREIDRTLGAEAQLEAVPSQGEEGLNEPILIAVIVALGGPKIIKAIQAVLERRYQHLEEMRRLDGQLRENEMQHEYGLAELRLLVTGDGGEEREISEQDLGGLAA